jgi:hypothetical protein
MDADDEPLTDAEADAFHTALAEDRQCPNCCRLLSAIRAVLYERRTLPNGSQHLPDTATVRLLLDALSRTLDGDR